MKTRSILFLSAGALAAALLASCSGGSSGAFQGYIEGEYVYVAAPLGGALTNLAVARGGSVTNGSIERLHRKNDIHQHAHGRPLY